MKRREIAVSIILTFVTCGIYGIYWFIVMTDEMNLSSNKPNPTSGGMAFLFSMLTCGIYSYYWAYTMGDQVDMLKANRGVQSSNTGILYLLLCIFGLSIVTYALLQNELNTMYDSGYGQNYNNGQNY